MLHTHRSLGFRVLALAGAAGAAALLSNRLATPARRLAWAGPGVSRSSPPPGTRNLPPLESPPHPPATQEAKGAPSIPPNPPASRVAMPPPLAPPRTPEAPAFSPIREISGREAWKAFQSGVPFLDARRSSEFAEGHIAGAWCTPVWESDVDDRLLSFKAARRPGSEDPIVIYCSGGDCRDSHLLAAKLLKDGYSHLLIYRDGFPEWVAQGHPVEKGQS